MKIIRTALSMAAWSERLRREGVTIGFVPTMGALHDGHRSLIRAARLRCDALVVSIFVNPAQFSSTEDFSTYPHPIARDRALCREEGVDVCFEPTAHDMYPESFQTTVTVPALARRWEGEARPHHFAGVATVVTKLFGMVQPHLALFGQKDYQQAALIRQLVNDKSRRGNSGAPNSQRAGWAGHEFAQRVSQPRRTSDCPLTLSGAQSR
jgi:pantoate--beta-alanine ligase